MPPHNPADPQPTSSANPPTLYQQLKGISRLPGTRSEAAALQRLLRVAPLLGAEATEEAVHRAQAPLILHIASHGVLLAVTSLWPVSDRDTGELMISYYRNLIEGKKPRVGAMEEAMLAMRKKRPHPYYWAPFLVIGQDGPLRGLSSNQLAGAVSGLPRAPGTK